MGWMLAITSPDVYTFRSKFALLIFATCDGMTEKLDETLCILLLLMTTRILHVLSCLHLLLVRDNYVEAEKYTAALLHEVVLYTGKKFLGDRC